jgi:alginate production protein
MSALAAYAGPPQAQDAAPGNRTDALEAGNEKFSGRLLPMNAAEERARRSDADFDFDSPPATRFRLTPDLSFGAKAELEAEREENFDLDLDKQKDETSVEPRLSMSLSYTPKETIQAYLNVEASYLFIDDDRDLKDDEKRLQVKQAFLSFSGLPDGATVKLGRQRFRDEREWLADEELDGIRLFHHISRFAGEVSAARRNDRDLLNDQEFDKVDNYFLRGLFAANKDQRADLYLLGQNDRRDNDEDRLYLGLYSGGEPLDDLDYWLNLAYLWGEADSNDIRAYGVDVGGTYVFDVAFDPSITLGYAYGSGDAEPDDGRDGNFRQTGLQDNTARLNGLIRLKYYGETVDPELSNLQIASAGVGIRPTKSTSLDLVYHNYRQVEASTQVRDWELRKDPNGRSTDIGYGVDLVAGYRIKPHYKGSLIFGHFRPGSAFDDDADDAYYAELELMYEF